MKNIYILLTHTGTFLSKTIKLYTRDEYTHASIALDKKLKQLYSFGRLNPYNAFIGGFVHEKPKKGTYKRFKKTKASIYELTISEVQYKKLKAIMKEINREQEQYKFNTLGLFLSGLNINIHKNKKFYCSEFVKHSLQQAQVKTDLPEITKPDDLKNIKNLKLIYKGLLNSYHEKNDK